MFELHPVIILAVGILTVVGMIIVLRVNAFIALITAAMVVSMLAPGNLAEKITRVAEAFGSMAGKIGVVIALAAVIGRCLIDSGAADRIVRLFLSMLGEKRCAISLMSSGFILSVPVFFDTVFYLLVPLARSMYRRTQKNYLKFIMAIAGGAAITHTLVPPTPGPLIIANTLGVDLGVMIIVGVIVAIPSAVAGILYAGWLNRRMNVPMRPIGGGQKELEPLAEHQLPGLVYSILPIILPVLMIATHTIISTLANSAAEISTLKRAAEFTAVVGNPNLAMLVSASIAMFVLWRQRQLTRNELAQVVETSLMSGGVIILITAAGGAFGAMLNAAEIGPAIQNMFAVDGEQQLGGLMLLGIGFFITSLIKVAQGSSTVAMITSSALFGAMITSNDMLGYHPVYLATTIASGSLFGCWLNDSGFWIFVKMGGLTEIEGLKSYTVLTAILSLVGMAVTVLLATVMPLV